MICTNCKKEFARPLELFDGTLSCPLCRHDLIIVNGSEPCNITRVNDELFCLAEICYMNALKATSQRAYHDGVQSAIELCKKAAWLKHPKALVRMGFFYDMGYVTVDGAEASKIAKQYYRAVWDNDVLCENELKNSYHGEIEKIKQVAATRYLTICSREGNELFVKERQAVINAGFKADVVERDIEISQTDKAERVMEILFEMCYSRRRAPIFGIIELSAKDVASLAFDDDRAEKLAEIAPHTTMVVFDGAKLDNTPWRIKTRQSLVDISQIEGKSYFCFFNTKGGHELSQRQLLKVQAALEAKNSARLYEIVKIARKRKADLVFYDDDIMKFQSRSDVNHAVDLLIKYADKGEN